jgi:deoxyribodipyrimidine photo-lyase
MPDQIQKQMGCKIGKDYPAPIIDHKWARLRALDAYKKAKLGEKL